MPLIVEDGSGIANADSYCSLAEASAYHADRGNTLWATGMSDTEREQALRRGTEYMVQVYRDLWAGSRKTIAQSLDWPRYEVPIKDSPTGYGAFPSYYADDEVPLAVRQACAVMAFKAASGDLAPDVGTPVKREKVGPIEVEYQDGARQTVRYQVLDNMLAPFLRGGQSYVRVVRA